MGTRLLRGYNQWCMPIALRARVVFPVDRPPIVGGVVTIEGDRIVEVGEQTTNAAVTDLGSVALLPGLVNAHTHLEFSHLRKPLGQPGMPLAEWIRLVIAERGRSDAAATPAVVKGLQESIAGGVTTVGDIATSVTEAVTTEPACISFYEVIGFSRARAESAVIALTEKLDDRRNADRRIGISPHAPYTVSPDLLRKLVAESVRRNQPVAMHLAESREELELLADGTGPLQELLDERSMWDASAITPGTRPLDYLRRLAEAPRSLIIHGNYLKGDELTFIAKNRERMSLIYCPRTHAYFQHSPYPLEEALACGVRVAIGTDSHASNPDLSILAEMQHVARTHPTISLLEVLRMGTLAGAEALGLNSEVGSLSPGKLANIVAVPLAETASDSLDSLLSSLFSSDSPVNATWYRGRQLSFA